MTIPPNIWQDNFLTGSTPFVIYPRLVAAPGAPVNYGFQITPAELPTVYTLAGANIFPDGNPKAVAPNTIMDVNRYEQQMAALTPGHGVSDLNLSGIDAKFDNATLYNWSLGLERKFGNLTGDLGYVGTAATTSAIPMHFPERSTALLPTPPLTMQETSSAASAWRT